MTGSAVLRAAVLGLGVGEQHARAYRDHPASELVLLCDHDEVRLAEVARSFPGVRTTTSAEEVLADPTVDVVSIATYDDAHHGQVLAALRARKHVMVEKPLCVSEQELDEIRSVLQEAAPAVRLTSNLVLRREPRFVELRERIRAGRLGTPHLLEGSYDYGRWEKIVGGWRGRVPDYSVMHGGGIHLLDLLLWLKERPIVEVAAFGSDLAARESGFPGRDLVVALLRFADGAVGQVTANFASSTPHHHRVAVFGTQGTFVQTHGSAAYLWGRGTSSAREDLRDPYPVAAKARLVTEFVDHLASGAPVAVSAEETIAAMSVSVAIERSVRSGGAVTVPGLA